MDTKLVTNLLHVLEHILKVVHYSVTKEMKTAWRKLLRIKQIYSPSRLFKQDKDMLTKFSIRTNNISTKFHLSVLKKSNYLGVVQFPVYFNLQDEQVSISFKDGHIAAEIKKQQMYLYLKTSGTSRTRIRIKPNNLTVQATLPAKYGEATIDFNFGPYPVLGISYNLSKFNSEILKKTYFGALYLADPQVFLYTNMPNFSYGIVLSTESQYFAWKANGKYISMTQEFQRHNQNDMHLSQQLDVHYKYGDIHIYTYDLHYAGGFTIFPLQYFGKEEEPRISTSFIMHDNFDMYTFVSAKIMPSVEIGYTRFQPMQGPGRNCLNFLIDFRTANNDNKEINIDE